MKHKNIPCPKCNRIWMWLEHATPENPVCPKGYGCNEITTEASVKEKLNEILKRLDSIESKINSIRPITYPTNPDPLIGVLKCWKCGIEWKGSMGYVCPDMTCPVQLKVSSQTYNISTSIADFDIEDPDPDKRSWYYDDYGIKRKKEDR